MTYVFTKYNPIFFIPLRNSMILTLLPSSCLFFFLWHKLLVSNTKRQQKKKKKRKPIHKNFIRFYKVFIMDNNWESLIL